MTQPIITPAEDQPLWALMQELEALGGVRHQDFKAVAGSPRWGYQVTPELYQKWLEAGGVDTTGETDTPPPTADPDGTAEAAAAESTQDSGEPSDTETEADKNAAQPSAEDPAQEDTKDAPKTSTTKRGARGGK